ncbi:hypothetical protein EAD96_00260, partial [Micromonospora sp. BL1]
MSLHGRGEQVIRPLRRTSAGVSGADGHRHARGDVGLLGQHGDLARCQRRPARRDDHRDVLSGRRGPGDRLQRCGGHAHWPAGPVRLLGESDQHVSRPVDRGGRAVQH